MKHTPRWAWENMWLLWACLSLVVLPIAFGWLTVAGLWPVLVSNPRVVASVAGLGILWGASQVFFGLALPAAGIAVAFAVILGLSLIVGSLVPLVTTSTLSPSAHVMAILAGIVIAILGVAVCMVAARKRDAARGVAAKVSIVGLLYCIAAGLGSGIMNVGLVAGAPLMDDAFSRGTPAAWTQHAVWVPFLLGGAVPNLIFCWWRLRSNQTARLFRAPGTDWYWVFALLMAICWFGSAVTYGMAAAQMGAAGPVLAWPVYMSLLVIAGTVAGILTGEWKLPGRKPLRTMALGISLLTSAIAVVTLGSW
jgi:L-rhamnose-H+ transport protein